MLHNHQETFRAFICWRQTLTLVGLVLFFCGCASRTTRKTASVNSAKNIQISATELSSRNQSLLALYSAGIEAAADKIILESPSPIARTQALVWKAEAIPVLQTSLLKADPVAAVVDSWTFIFQMKAYVEQPWMKGQLGESLSVVTDTLNRMDLEMEHLVLAAAPAANVPDLRTKISAWAAAHPIQTGLTGRKSVDSGLLEEASESDLGALASIKALQESMGDITARLDSYNSYFPKQARWQAELLVADLLRNPEIDRAVSNLGVISQAMNGVSKNLDRVPELAARAREVAFADVQNQREAAQSFLREEREQTLEALKQQRIEAMADLNDERLAATSDFRGERQIVLAAVPQEEVSVMNDLRALSQQTLDDFDKRSRRLMNQLFWHAFELMLLTLILSFSAGWILLHRFTSRSLRSRDHFRSAA